MVDLGVFNFIKNALAEGKTKEFIGASLAKGGMGQEAIDEAFQAVETDAPPSVAGHTLIGKKDIPLSTHTIVTPDEHRPMLVTAICGYIFFSTGQNVISASLSSLLGHLPLTITIVSVTAVAMAAMTIASFIGYWQMKRWGVMLYTLTTFILVLYLFSQLHMQTAAELSSALDLLISQLLLPCIAVGIGFAYFDDMS